FKKSAYEVISYASAVAGLLNTSLKAIAIGDIKEDELSSLGKYGVSDVLHVRNEKLKNFAAQVYASVIAEAAKSEGSEVIVLANSFSGKGLAPRLSVRLQAGLADSAVELTKIDNNTFTVKKTAFS